MKTGCFLEKDNEVKQIIKSDSGILEEMEAKGLSPLPSHYTDDLTYECHLVH